MPLGLVEPAGAQCSLGGDDSPGRDRRQARECRLRA
jgi:hypothetical protein